MTKKRSKRGKENNQNYKKLVQIRTNSHGWTTVEFIGFKNGKIVVKMSDGQIIHRHLNQVKYGVAQRIRRKNPLKKKSDKKYKNSKYKHKLSKGKKKDKTALKGKKRGRNESDFRAS
jgi:hypothetical protein